MDKKFNELGVQLSKPVLKTIKDLNFKNPTPVQEVCIPYLLQNKDVAAQAVTGSGKTLAFVIPLIELLVKRSDPLKKFDIGALIISPTRELATQTDRVLDKFLANINGITSLLIVGGRPVMEDVKRLKENGANIIVATPGRLEELFTKNFPDINLHRSIKQLELLVLDEADKLLDLGFEKSLTTILKYLPVQRRTGLFSATQTTQLTSLVRAGLRNPFTVVIKEQKIGFANGNDNGDDEGGLTPRTLSNYYYICEADQKLSFLLNFIKNKGVNLKYMVFLSTCACVDYFTVILKSLVPEILLFSLHGKMKDKRYTIFDEFRDSESGIMLCTDVMARGVDIPEVHWVIQYDPPSSASSFVHRAGRTARIGRNGNSVLLLMPNEDPYVNFILRNQKVVLEELTNVDIVNTDVDVVVNKVRQLQLNDRKVFDKANKAFVSFIQSYSKHECNLILRVKDLNFSKLAMGFGLLKLPKMPELKCKDVSSFQAVDIDFNSIKYLNEKYEAVRLRHLQTYQETGIWPGKKSRKRAAKQSTPWAVSKLRKVERQERKKLKKEKSILKASEGKIKKKRNKKQKFTADEINELAKDIALMKKFKKKKISNEEFNNKFGINEAD